jgi:hypothetical protein
LQSARFAFSREMIVQIATKTPRASQLYTTVALGADGAKRKSAE